MGVSVSIPPNKERKVVRTMGYPRITSRQNHLAREAAALAASADKRREEALFLCEGARLCQDAALSGLKILRCFFTDLAAEKYGKYLEAVLDCCEEAYRVEEHVAELLSSTKNSQGIFCVCKYPPSFQAEALLDFPPEGPCVVLENLQDPGNLGTVLRTAEALGIGRVFLLGKCCDPLSPKALRASMGAVFRVELAMERSPQALKERLERKGYALHAAVPDASARLVTDIHFSQGLHAVFIGNEGNGLTEETVALCHDRVTIPMAGRAESLNASAAATILLWEMKRGGASHG